MDLIYKSQQYTMVAGSTTPIDLNFLPARGPNGKRLVVERILLNHIVQVDTDGSTTIAQGGWYAFNQRTILKDLGGEMVNLTGQEIHAVHQYERGREAFPAPTALAVSQSNAQREIPIFIDLAPVKSRRRWDYAVPTDQFLAIPGGQLMVTAASAAQVGTGAGTTIDSHTLTVYVYCREEKGVEAHSRRELRSQTLANAVDNTVPVNGMLVRQAFIMKAADSATGGTTEDATQVTIDALGLSQIEPTALIKQFGLEAESDFSSATDPFVQTAFADDTQTPKALPLVWTRKRDSKINELPFHGGSILVRLTGGTVTNNVIVFDYVAPHTEKNTQVSKALARDGKGGRRVKTFGKTQRNPDAHGIYARFMPARLAG